MYSFAHHYIHKYSQFVWSIPRSEEGILLTLKKYSTLFTKIISLRRGGGWKLKFLVSTRFTYKIWQIFAQQLLTYTDDAWWTTTNAHQYIIWSLQWLWRHKESSKRSSENVSEILPKPNYGLPIIRKGSLNILVTFIVYHTFQFYMNIVSV